ncbi:serine hydrolase [Brachybacterium sp. Marseille-Q2903]|uniref:Serine hydrolase n=1 Tax=Brachybacterium epidermidis TaxID=2781983 RepID=A0ABR9VYU3_9MICO|nr:serine hydrolase domain-containing protein [Brachybacterium epidermidis]MBE9403346.1 serine hydrolase [Brachybacterium epidermidis]
MSGHTPHPLTRRAAVAGTAITFGVGAAIPAALADPAEKGSGRDKPTPRNDRAKKGAGTDGQGANGGDLPDPWDRSGPNDRPVREGNPRSVGLDPDVLDQLPGIIRAGLGNDPPRFSGTSLLVASQGRIAYEHADGYALRWKNPTEQLPEDQWVPARQDTIYDLASISKLFTATAVMQLVERGQLSLEDTVASHLPRFGENGKEQVTIQHLLTHVGGLPPFINLRQAYPDVPSRIDAALTVKPTAAPGTKYVYSDLGLIALGQVVEVISGQSLDVFVQENITAPLGMTETMYNPPAELLDRIAATEYMTVTGELVRGHVHDENAYSLGGVAGHAGVFSTARDLAVFAQMFLNGGTYGGARVLQTSTVQDMFTDRIAEVTGAGGARRGLGPELAAWYYHAGLTSPYSGAHTGFTGTSLVIDPLTDTIVIMLANSVHPTREWSTTSVTRREVSTCVAHALGIVPKKVRDGWHAGNQDAATATLEVAVDLDGSATELTAELFYHLEEAYDLLTVEASADDGSTWTPLAGTLTSKDSGTIGAPTGSLTGWGRRARWDATFPLVAGGSPLTGEVQLRLAAATDGLTRGLGVWVGRIQVRAAGGGKKLLDTQRGRDRDAFVADGWVKK